MNRFPRSSGILLHPTALPGTQGIGTLGRQARNFLRWMVEAGQSYWQICPLVPTGYGDSPYQGFSAFAGNPNLIDLEELQDQGLLSSDDLAGFRTLPEDRVDFGRLIPLKQKALQRAWKNFSSDRNSGELGEAFEHFRKTTPWLEDFSLFMTLKSLNDGRPWNLWPEKQRLRNREILSEIRSSAEADLGFHAFTQFVFHRQWSSLKSDANELGIHVIGDLPIFVAYDSSDCWSQPELFQLDAERLPTRVAGVPPDYFSSTGQLWGNPLYDWTVMEKNGFRWWISVLKNKLDQYDALRIDHFRGFSAYWAVPAGEKTAVNGEWVPSPGHALFSKVKTALGELPIIAEDLGVITEDVVELIETFGFPGMKVLQFAFDSSEENDYLPHNYDNHCLVYSGTHDNDTAAGWYESAPERDRQSARAYLNLPDDATGKTAAWAMIRTALSSVADLAVLPLQDVLGLGSEARFNTPGVLGGNWSWRSSESAFGKDLAARIRKLTRVYGRLPSEVET